MRKVGLYIHIPFCVKKCGYCDFYSVVGDDMLMDAYTSAVISALGEYKDRFVADTVYFGGGTPSVLGGKRISLILNAAKEFITPDAEITVEVNPGDNLNEFFAICSHSGVNRVSIGLQSANDSELKRLTRRHSSGDVSEAVRLARLHGIDNISLDLMLATEGQTEGTITQSIDFCADLNVNHISAYMLKIEQGTPFAKKIPKNLPDEDAMSDFYLYACEKIESMGYRQYEISNFAKDGCQSQHNNIYWKLENYVGIGPSAHSCFNGKRFYYPRDIKQFIENPQTIPDGEVDIDEYIMLSLRLKSGLNLAELKEKWNKELTLLQLKKLEMLKKQGLITFENNTVSLTPKGFLMENAIACEIMM